MIKRPFLLVVAATLFSVSVPGTALAQRGWDEYKSRFVSKDGRVIDYYQNHASHSEGQGYGMLLAVANKDRKTFEKMNKWTDFNLSGRTDNLFPWLWGERPTGAWKVIDMNNATDGDLLISLARIKAYERWGEHAYLEQARRTLKDIRENLAVEVKGRTYLLPSYYGFADEGTVVLNPSYMVTPAYLAFARYGDAKFWNKVYADAVWLLGKVQMGDLRLPPDWITIRNGKPEIFESKSTRHSYEAIRVLLHLAVTNPDALPEGTDKMLELYEKMGFIPRWADLKEESISLSDAPAGFYAVYALAARKTGRDALAEKLYRKAEEKLEHDTKSYYTYSLYMLATTPGAF